MLSNNNIPAAQFPAAAHKPQVQGFPFSVQGSGFRVSELIAVLLNLMALGTGVWSQPNALF